MLYLSLKLTVLMLLGSNMSIWEDFQKFIGMGQQQTQQVAAPTPAPAPEPAKPDYYQRLAMAESSGKAEAKAATSSAAGLYQFTEGTWKEYNKKYGLGLKLDDRFDPAKSKLVVEKFTEDNKKQLKQHLGTDPTDTDLYAAHFLGVSGAKKFLSAAPKKLAKDVVTPDQYKANKSIFYDSKTKKPRTVAQVYGLLQKKIGE
jgi:hypothetical protein